LAPATKSITETQPKGNYQVAVKNNATIDNHQLIRAYHYSSQENIPGQPRWASKLIAAYSSNTWAEVSSHQGTKASIKTSQSVDLLGQEHQPPKNNHTTPATSSHQQHYHS
jgi:hypothetical protein